MKSLIENHPDFFPMYTVSGKWHHDGREVDALDRRLSRRHDVAVPPARRATPGGASKAEHYSKLLEHRQHDRNVHDLGFIFLSTYLPWYELTGDKHLHDVLIQAGRTLAMRFKEKGQYLRSFVSDESLFIDIMMNVPIIFYAAIETGDRELARVATAHCRTTRDTIVRPDGSTAHEGIFDLKTGEFLREDTHQGLAPNSAWARGLAWSLYGYSKCYALTGNREFLDVAERNADYWLDHLPADGVPLLGFSRRPVAAAAVGRAEGIERRRDRRQRPVGPGPPVARCRRPPQVRADGAEDARRARAAGVSGQRHARLGRHSQARRLSHEEEPGRR